MPRPGIVPVDVVARRCVRARVDGRRIRWISSGKDGVSLVFALKLLGIVINTVLVAPAVAVVAAFDPRWAYDLSRFWAIANLRICGVDVASTRHAQLDPSRPYVFMSNHASHF